MISWPEDLVNDIAARRSVLFLGAGVSKNARNAKGEHPMDWKEFLRYLATRVPDDQQRDEILLCVNEGDLLTACELARKYLHRDGFKTALLQQFADKAFQHADIHDNLSRVDSRFVLTTNFDKLYENRAKNHNELAGNRMFVLFGCSNLFAGYQFREYCWKSDGSKWRVRLRRSSKSDRRGFGDLP